MSNNVIAMVPVRAGSTRVPNKNTRPFGGTSLLQLKLELLKKVVGITRIVVSTDCDTSADMALKEGAEVQWQNEYYAGSDALTANPFFFAYVPNCRLSRTVYERRNASPPADRLDTIERQALRVLSHRCVSW